jgi:hypothetical protein
MNYGSGSGSAQNPHYLSKIQRNLRKVFNILDFFFMFYDLYDYMHFFSGLKKMSAMIRIRNKLAFWIRIGKKYLRRIHNTYYGSATPERRQFKTMQVCLLPIPA